MFEMSLWIALWRWAE